jgi:L-seryl-tRNA(Ser) seleniumtransferase
MTRSEPDRAAAGARFEVIPSVGSILADDELRAATSLTGPLLTDFIRRTLAEVRRTIAAGEQPTERAIRQRLLAELRRLERPRLAPIVNATGVIVHTNLGRAPVSAATASAMAAAASAPVTLELDPESGQRGGRMGEIASLLRLLTGAESAIVVNNNAAAILLALSTLASGREVILSRGEAVEIGGGFRIPDVLRQSGATLVEVGTTNRTYASDYEAALTERTAALLKVHPSNFRLSGFVHSAAIAELAPIARRWGVPLVEDLGSGALLETAPFGLAPEPTIAESLRAGASIVTASGDKLLGGPQAGIICGDASLIANIERHPLARAVRADKTCLAGLAQTLRHYVSGEATTEIPVWRMISAAIDGLAARAARMRTALAARGVEVETVESLATVGGGSLPGETLPSVAIAVGAPSPSGIGNGADRVARKLRLGEPAVFGRIEDQRLLLDLRSVLPEDDERLSEAVVAALTGRAEDAASP